MSIRTTYSLDLGYDSLPLHGVQWIALGASIIGSVVHSSTCIHVQSFGHFYRIIVYLEISLKDVRVGYVLAIGIPLSRSSFEFEF